MNEARALGADSRLSTGPADALAASAFADELRAAPYLLPWLGIADLAHVAMMSRAGVVDAPTARRVLAGLLALEEAGTPIALDPAVGDVYNNRDAVLRDHLGRDAGVIHTGRARREATTIAWQLACRERIIAAGSALARLTAALGSVAREHRSAIMPDYTYLQAAQPTTLGHYLLGYVFPLLRDHTRLTTAFGLVNRSPAGSGSVNGSRFAFDHAWIAELLGFEGVVEHTRDAMWAPDMATEQLTALATTLTNVDRLVEDAQIWATSEFGYLDLDDGHTRTSVIMPHKKNPYSLAWTRGRARFLIGRWVGVVGTFLTPSGQPDNRITAYVEVPAALDDATLCLDLVADVFRAARFDVDRMAQAACHGYLSTSDLCDLFVETTGIDNRSAHRIVGYAVRERLEGGGGPLEPGDMRKAASALDLDLPDFDEAEFARTLDPEHLVGLRRQTGGSGADPMGRMLERSDAETTAARAHWDDHPLRGFRARFLDDIRSTIEGLVP